MIPLRAISNAGHEHRKNTPTYAAGMQSTRKLSDLYERGTASIGTKKTATMTAISKPIRKVASVLRSPSASAADPAAGEPEATAACRIRTVLRNAPAMKAPNRYSAHQAGSVLANRGTACPVTIT